MWTLRGFMDLDILVFQHLGERGDEAPRLALHNTVAPAFADDFQHLLDSRPADVIVETGGAGQPADFDPSVTFVIHGHRLPFASPFRPTQKAASAAVNSCEISRNNVG